MMDAYEPQCKSVLSAWPSASSVNVQLVKWNSEYHVNSRQVLENTVRLRFCQPCQSLALWPFLHTWSLLVLVFSSRLALIQDVSTHPLPLCPTFISLNLVYILPWDAPMHARLQSQAGLLVISPLFPSVALCWEFLFFSDRAWPDFVKLLHCGLEAN